MRDSDTTAIASALRRSALVRMLIERSLGFLAVLSGHAAAGITKSV